MSEIKAPPGHTVFPLSEPVGNSATGITAHVFLPQKLRARHMKGVKIVFDVENGKLELSADTVMAVLRNCTGLDADVFDELSVVDLFKMGVAMAGELGKFLPTSMTSSATSPGSSTSDRPN